MSSAGSVTHWIRELKAGNHLAAQELWEKYFQRLVALARSKLRNRPRRVADEEDVGPGRSAGQEAVMGTGERESKWSLRRRRRS
jgi:hypothetical protein